MTNRKFPIIGCTHMLGRVKFIQELWTELTKATPSNMSLYGPRSIGKTVMVNALAQKAKQEGSPYSFIVHWHLGHVAPSSDEEFIVQLCEQMRDSLASAGSAYEQHREYLRSHMFADLKEVTDSLNSEGKSILMIWDGFDKPLGQGKLSNNLWDQMRSIFNGKNHKIIIVTRGALLDSIRTHGISDFWNLFYMNNMKVEPFNDDDREAILSELPEITFNQGSKTELLNWSAGIPILFLEILNHVVNEFTHGTVDNEVINCAALKATESISDLINILWDDCPAQAKDVYSLLVDGELIFTDVGKEERNCLLERGFARQTGNKLTKSCRMLQQYVTGAGPDAGSIARLFGTWKDYIKNIRGLLQRRMTHISRFDERLCRLVDRAIEDIPDYSNDCLNNLTGIRDYALKLIWQREFGTEMSIPADVIAYWTASPRSNNTLVTGMTQSNCWTIPTDPLEQVRLLGLLTGSVRNFDIKAKTTSKDTYVLINAIHNFRNRVEHSDGQSMHLGVAVAAIMTCLELLSCLERELV